MLTRALTRRSRATRARALAARFPVLANRNFRLLLADRLMAPLAATFSLVGVSFAVLAATGSTADLSYVIAAQAAPALVFLLVGGVIADRIAPQLVIVAANDPRAARRLVGVPVAHLAVGYRAAVHRCADRLGRRLPGARARRGEGAPRRRRSLGPHLGRRGDRPDRRRPDLAALDAQPAHPVRGPDRRGNRGLARLPGHAAAALDDLRDLVRARCRHRDNVCGLDSHHGGQDPGGEARARVWV